MAKENNASFLFLQVFLYSLIIPLLFVESSVVVRLQEGKISSVTRTSFSGREFQAFLGVPYAEAPIGLRRFLRPQSKRPWRSVLKAENDPPMCPQSKKNVSMSEDCLYLNIYTPRVTGSLPVMVYIPGGAFVGGDIRSNHWGPEYLLDKDIVLVMVQYRVGMLGFVSTADRVALGNYGMKDQVKALRWVQRNIRKFGGDRRRVTLAGHSAGGSSVSGHALSTLSRGLFHQYIQMSGNILTARSFNKGELGNYKKFIETAAQRCDCPVNNSLVMINCLKQTSVEKLVSLNVDPKGNDLFPSFSIVKEPHSEHAFLTLNPNDIIMSSGMIDVPALLGIVQHDGLFLPLEMLINDDTYELYVSQLDKIILNIIEFFVEPEISVRLVDKVKESYFKNFTSANREERTYMFSNLFTDLGFAYPAYKIAESQLRHGSQPLYFYNFEYRGTISRSSKVLHDNRNLGVQHADELTYLFKQKPADLGNPNATYSENDYKMIKTMVDLWTSFVISGKPITEGIKNSFEWKPYGAERNYLRIGRNTDVTSALKQHFKKKEMSFWSNLFGENII